MLLFENLRWKANKIADMEYCRTGKVRGLFFIIFSPHYKIRLIWEMITAVVLLVTQLVVTSPL